MDPLLQVGIRQKVMASRLAGVQSQSRHILRRDVGGGSGAAVEQFTVVQIDATHVAVYGGFWHRVEMTRVGSSAPYSFYPKTQSTRASSTGTVKFGAAVGSMGDAIAITATCKLWLKLNWAGLSDVLTGEVLASPGSDPAMTDEKTYWLPFAIITFTSGAIAGIDPMHTGSIVTTDYGHPVSCVEDPEEYPPT